MSIMTVTRRASSSARYMTDQAALTVDMHGDDGSPLTTRASTHEVCYQNLDEQHGIDTAVEVRVIGDLCVLGPDDLARLRHKTQL